MVGLSRKRVFPKTKGDSITGQDRAQKHCDFRFSQIEKKSKVAVLQLLSEGMGIHSHRCMVVTYGGGGAYFVLKEYPSVNETDQSN